MALVDNVWYINFGDGSTTGWWAVTKRPQNTAVAAGVVRRQFTAPAAFAEKCFVCIVAGTTQNVTDATWVTTRGAKTTDGTVTWQECTGIAALNGDATNTPSWTITATPPGGVKGTAVTLGQVIKRDSGASYQICTTAGTAGSGSEPAFSDTAGVTTSDNTVTWTSLGLVGNFSAFSAPHAHISTACVSTWGQDGNKFYVHSASQETSTASITISIGTVALPCYFICVNGTHAPPLSGDVTTGAKMAVAGGVNRAITICGVAGNVQYWDGIKLLGDDNTLNSIELCLGRGSAAVFRNGTLGYTSGTSNSTIILGTSNNSSNNASSILLDNVILQFSSTGQTLSLAAAKTIWRGGSLSGTVPTNLISYTVPACGTLLCQGVDLSALGSGKTLVGANVLAQYHIAFVDCRLGASVTIGQPTVSNDLLLIDLVRCDSGSVNYRNERWSYAGAMTTETTIVRTNGATDGVTPVSRKIVTTANAAWAFPFNDAPIAIWNDTVGSVTLTIYGIWAGGAAPLTDEIWIDVEYLSASGSPLGSFINTSKANVLASGGAGSSDGSSWGGSTTAFKMSVTFTANMKGPIYVTVRAAKTSSTFYYDPQPVLS